MSAHTFSCLNKYFAISIHQIILFFHTEIHQLSQAEIVEFNFSVLLKLFVDIQYFPIDAQSFYSIISNDLQLEMTD